MGQHRCENTYICPTTETVLTSLIRTTDVRLFQEQILLGKMITTIYIRLIGHLGPAETLLEKRVEEA
jgi:hypothetical protein